MLILINQYLLNVVFSMAKALNSQNSPRAEFSFPPTFSAIWKTLLLLMLVLVFFSFFFWLQVL